jgi:hypothetical protein
MTYKDTSKLINIQRYPLPTTKTHSPYLKIRTALFWHIFISEINELS